MSVDSGVVGSVALWASIVAAAVQVGGWLFGGQRRAVMLAGPTTVILATVALGALLWSLLTGNFALAYVADTTTRQGSWAYRFAGLWGGNEGSLLLWAWIVIVAGAWATRRRPAARLVTTMAGGSLLLLTAVAASPFRRLSIAAIDGGGLTPILQYPAMLYHPPLLYAGHAGLVVPFALAIAGLASGHLDAAWLQATRRWMLGAWLLLGIGLLAGAHWSYAELGWGGFWAWDPVENSGLLAWLGATAFLHGARRATIRNDQRSVLGGLAALPFCLSLLGAAVTRSGAAQSVHAFAEAGPVGRGLLAILTVAFLATLVLVVRARMGTRGRPPVAPLWSPDAALTGATMLMLAIALVVGAGTVYPVLVHAITGQHVAVTATYYAIVVTPLAVVALVALGVGPSLPPAARTPWRRLAIVTGRAVVRRTVARRTVASAAKHLPIALTAAVVALVAAIVLAGPHRSLSVSLGAAAAFAVVLTIGQLARARELRRVGLLLAHAGMAILLLGVAGSLVGKQSSQVVQPGSTMTVSGFALRYREITADQGVGWQRVKITFDVSRAGRRVATLRPALRVFPARGTALSDVAMRSTMAQDVVVAVREVDPASHAAIMDVTVRPVVRLVWWGGLLAAVGGAVVLLQARRDQGRLRSRPARLRSRSLPMVAGGAGPD